MIVHKYEIYLIRDAQKHLVGVYDTYKECSEECNNILSIMNAKDKLLISLGKYELTKID